MFDRITNVIMYTTTECNMACTYCLNSINGVKSNSPENVPENYAEKFSDFIKKLTSPKIFVSFFGGEPLLQQDLCLDILDRLKDKPGVEYIVQTNGTLLNTVKPELALNPSVRFALSVDGDKDRHDSCRVFKDGSGTWDRVLENVEEWKKKYPSSSLAGTITHYHSETIDTIRKVKILNGMGFKKIHFVTIKEPVLTQRDIDETYEGYSQLIDYLMLDPDLIITTFFEHRISDRKALAAEYRAYKYNKFTKFACRAGDRRVFVDTQGNLYPCNLIMDKRFELGNIIQETYTNKHLLFKKVNDACDGCPSQYGGIFCSYRMSRHSGSPFYCSPLMKSLCSVRMKIYDKFFMEAKKYGWLDS